MSSLRMIKILGAAAAIQALAMGSALAAGAPCLSGTELTSAADMQGFLKAPASLLAAEPHGGLTLASKVRSLAGTDVAAADAFVTIASSATAEQKAAIGAGLGRAVVACADINPDHASKIQQAVARMDDGAVIAAFVAASNDVQVAAIRKKIKQGKNSVTNPDLGDVAATSSTSRVVTPAALILPTKGTQDTGKPKLDTGIKRNLDTGKGGGDNPDDNSKIRNG